MEMMQRIKRWNRLFAYWQENGRTIKPMQMQTVTCKHCGTRYQGNYCPRCGQSRAVSLITKRGFINAFMEAYPQLASTFLRTCWELLLRPGYMIRDYFRGHRVIYSGPFKTFIIIVSIYVLIAKLTGVTPEASSDGSGIKLDWTSQKPKQEQVNLPKPSEEEGILHAKMQRAQNIEKSISENQYIGPIWDMLKKKADEEGSTYLFLCVPLLALASKLTFRKQNFDGRQLIYAEHFMVFTYIYAINICFCLLAFVLSLPGVSEDSFEYPEYILLFYVVWTFKALYGMGWKETFRHMWKLLLWSCLFFGIALLILICLATLGIILL